MHSSNDVSARANGMSRPTLSSPSLNRDPDSAGSPSTPRSLKERSLCFDTSALSTPSVNVPKFVASVRARAPLSVVRDDLQSHLESVQKEIVAQIQRDFYTYVSLGPAVREVDGLVETIEGPLEGLKGDLGKLLEGIDEETRMVEGVLGERRRLAQRKLALEGLLKANDLLGKCERLLKEGREKDGGLDLGSLERVASESTQLGFCLAKAGEGEFVASIASRVVSVRKELKRALDKWLRKALFPDRIKEGNRYDNEILVRVLSAYAVAGMVQDAEDLFRSEIVAPFTSDRIQMRPMMAVAERESTLKGVSSANVNAAHGLEAAEREIITFLGEKVMPITSLCEIEERLKTFNFLGNAVWPLIENAIGCQMTSAFSPGIPHVFHRSFLSGRRIYAAVEASTSLPRRVVLLRDHKSTKSFWHRWNLPVYFQLRFQEITGNFESSLKTGPIPANRAEDPATGPRLLRLDVYQAKATVDMIEALRRCWAEDVYLQPLTHRFLRLSLQIFARYATWIRSGLSVEWSESSVLTGAALVYGDLTTIHKSVPAELSSLLRLRATGLDSGLLTRVDNAFSESIADLVSLQPELVKAISRALSQPCKERLGPLRGILTTYRMPSKPAPVTYSPFIPKVLRPLRNFILENKDQFGTEVEKRIVTAVANTTSGKYYDMASDLLASNRKSEETLRRLNIGREGSFGSSLTGSGSITEKITKQLHLDISKFKDEVEDLGGAVEDMPSFSNLWGLVQDVEQEKAETLAERAQQD